MAQILLLLDCIYKNFHISSPRLACFYSLTCLFYVTIVDKINLIKNCHNKPLMVEHYDLM